MVEIDTFYFFFCVVFSVHIPYLLMVGLNRLELLTSRLSGVRSNQLSYRPMYLSAIVARLWCKQRAITSVMCELLMPKS